VIDRGNLARRAGRVAGAAVAGWQTRPLPATAWQRVPGARRLQQVLCPALRPSWHGPVEPRLRRYAAPKTATP